MSRRIALNPFHVLEVRPGASAMEIERAGQRILAMLGVGLEAAATYPSPLGPLPRDADLVRRSLDELRDPAKRAVHEVWAALPPGDPPPADDRLAPWPEALRALGWERG